MFRIKDKIPTQKREPVPESALEPAPYQCEIELPSADSNLGQK